MSLFDKIDRHATLVNRMARALDLDLADKALSGAFPEQGFRSMVMACTGCSNPDGCEALLDANPDGLPEAPRYCRNHDLFATLAGD